MLAGKDTVRSCPRCGGLLLIIEQFEQTAAMMTITVYFLSQYPDVLKRLRDEILERVGPTRRPTYDDIREMKYLRAVINGMSVTSLGHTHTH